MEGMRSEMCVINTPEANQQRQVKTINLILPLLCTQQSLWISLLLADFPLFFFSFLISGISVYCENFPKIFFLPIFLLSTYKIQQQSVVLSFFFFLRLGFHVVFFDLKSLENLQHSTSSLVVCLFIHSELERISGVSSFLVVRC